MATDELISLLNKFSEDGKISDAEIERLVAGVPDEKLAGLVKDASPFRLTIPGSDRRVVSMSYTNMREDYMRDFHTVAMTGFLYQMLKEWGIPDEVPTVDLAEWQRNPAVAATPGYIKDPRLQGLYAERRAALARQAVVKEFLDSLFRFNPAEHAVSAYRGNKSDPSRKMYRSQTLRDSVAAGNTVRKVTPPAHAPSVKDIDDAKPPATPLAKTCTDAVPPRDTLARFERFRDENREELMQLTNDLYGSVPDMDIAVNVYAIHESEDEAKAFRQKYMDQVIAPITNVRANRWALLGPYRENRERVDFLNRDTEVLKAMLDARENDSRIGTDIMKKRAKVKKAKSVKEVGPDHPEFVKWARDNQPAIANMGGEYLGEAPEHKAEHKGEHPGVAVERKGNRVTVKDVSDTPDDHVEVNVFNVVDGGEQIEVSKVYNPVEAPSASGPPAPGK